MSTTSACLEAINTGEFIVQGYLGDLTDADLLHRPCPGANHINWQLGHLMLSEQRMMEMAKPGSMPALPDGFEKRYGKETASSDNASEFDTKETLLQLHAKQRAATLALLDQMTDADFAGETGIDYAPTVQSLFLMQSMHWLMHAGQWAVVRRQLGRAPLF
ncbi:MAG: DinB family protein [Planctomycetaceae bacterium]